MCIPAQTLLPALLTTTTERIIPLTATQVKEGCKVFGAAILRKSDLGIVVAATNNEVVSPLLHGEINCLRQFWALPADVRPEPKDCVFFATHEPCSLCLSGITWSGFDNHTFMFSYAETRDTFSIPHDIAILESVFRVRASGESDEDFAKRPLYNKSNAFWTARSFDDLLDELPEDQRDHMRQEVDTVKKLYHGLSETYQKDKGSKGIPLA